MLGSLIYMVTDLGDSAITAPLTFLLAAYLFLMRQKRAALAVVSAFAIAAMIIAASKIFIYSRCEAFDNILDLRSPSGHSAISAAVYGTLAAIVASGLQRKVRWLPYMLAAALVGLIALSRVALGHHTLSDVLVGTAIGFATALGLWHALLKGQAVTCRWWPFTLAALIILGILHGMHFPAEGIIDRISDFIRRYFEACHP